MQYILVLYDTKISIQGNTLQYNRVYNLYKQYTVQSPTQYTTQYTTHFNFMSLRLADDSGIEVR